MRILPIRPTLVLLGLAAWLAAGQSARAADLPKGTYTSSAQKDWSITFDGKGKYTVTRGKMAVVEGSYKVSGDELTLTDEKGPLVSKNEDEKTGKYKWKLDGNKLTFKPVADKSKGRELALTAGPWVMQQ